MKVTNRREISLQEFRKLVKEAPLPPMMGAAVALQSRELGQSSEETAESFKFQVVDLTLDTSYPTGGSINISNILGFASEQQVQSQSSGQIVAMVSLGPAIALGVPPTTMILCYYQSSTDKLQCFWTGAVVSTALAEVTAATNLSAFIQRFLVLAR